MSRSETSAPPASRTGLGRRLTAHGHQLAAHLAGLGLTAWVARESLSGAAGDPARTLILRSGTAGLIMLVAALACTPLAMLTGWRGVLAVRRALGLYGFAGVAIHLSAYVTFDGWLDPALIWRDLDERRAMLIGLLSFLALVPLALTSTAGWQRRLGRRWKVLHRLIYLALPLAVLHYLWLDRDVLTTPLLYAALVGLLLALRLPPLRASLVRLRQRLAGRRG